MHYIRFHILNLSLANRNILQSQQSQLASFFTKKIKGFLGIFTFDTATKNEE